MKMGVDILGLEGLEKLVQQAGPLFHKNLQAAMVLTAYDSREILREATKAPKAGGLASAAEHWEVVPELNGASVLNTDEKAAYLEFGTGIYNEGPGHKGMIVPRRDRVSGYAGKYKQATGKEAPRFLSWIDPKTGKRIFARKVKGFKGIAMVRGNLPKLREVFQHRAMDSIDATLEGRTYG